MLNVLKQLRNAIESAATMLLQTQEEERRAKKNFKQNTQVVFGSSVSQPPRTHSSKEIVDKCLLTLKQISDVYTLMMGRTEETRGGSREHESANTPALFENFPQSTLQNMLSMVSSFRKSTQKLAQDKDVEDAPTPAGLDLDAKLQHLEVRCLPLVCLPPTPVSLRAGFAVKLTADPPRTCQRGLFTFRNSKKKKKKIPVLSSPSNLDCSICPPLVWGGKPWGGKPPQHLVKRTQRLL
jgi:hypothetical protein